MKSIIELNRAILDDEFYESQFEEYGTDKNILFLNPQLSGKQLYKSILPFFYLHSENTYVAITNINKYDPIKQLTDIQINISAKEIMWADFIVIPFTAVDLSRGADSLYTMIRQINSKCKIAYCLDVNFYELPKKHPFASHINSDAVANIESNIWNADICIVNNLAFRDYLMQKLNQLLETTYKGIRTTVSITCIPFLIDSKIVTENVDYDVVNPEPVTPHSEETKSKIDKVSDKAEEIKQKDIQDKKQENKNGSGKTKQKTSGSRTAKVRQVRKRK